MSGRMHRPLLMVGAIVVALALPGPAHAEPGAGLAPGTLVVAGDSLDGTTDAFVAYPPRGKPYEFPGFNNNCVAIDGAGNIYFCGSNGVDETHADGSPATSISAVFPLDLAVDDGGDQFVVAHRRPAKVTLSVFPAGGRRPRDIGAFHEPSHVAIDRAGALYVTDNQGLWRINADGSGKTQLGGREFAAASGVAVDAGGDVYVSLRDAGTITVLAPDGSVLRTIGGLPLPFSPAFDAAGRLVASVGGNRVLRMEPDGSNQHIVVRRNSGDLAVYVPAGRAASAGG